jgi:hypothetical protein
LEFLLHDDGAVNCVHTGVKNTERSIAVVLEDLPIEMFVPVLKHLSVTSTDLGGTRFALLHQPGVTGDVGKHDGGKAARAHEFFYLPINYKISGSRPEFTI